MHEMLLVGGIATISHTGESGVLIVTESLFVRLNGNCSRFCESNTITSIVTSEIKTHLPPPCFVLFCSVLEKKTISNFQLKQIHHAIHDQRKQ